MGFNLLEKTELWVNEITLNNANLTEMARVTAEVLGIETEKVLVVDVRPRHITFDILAKDIPQENVIGKQETLLMRLGEIDGVNITEETFIHSNGILGTICFDETYAPEILDNIERMEKELRRNIAKRAIVYPTGFELKQGLIKDTNTPFLKEALEGIGYRVTVGDIIDDDLDIAGYHLSDALSRGFGLILTTGGVGAEDKDKSVEALLSVAPDAATEYIVKFTKGSGRHVKDGVRIGVGQVGLSTIVTLPGPNDEVREAAPVLLDCIEREIDQKEIAKRLADVLARKWMTKEHNHKQWHHHK